MEIVSVCTSIPIYFVLSIKKGAPFWRGFERNTQNLLHKGRPFILRRLLRKWPLSHSFFREARSHFLPPLSGRSPVNCLSETGSWPDFESPVTPFPRGSSSGAH